MGLVISRNLVHLMGGELTVESEGEGQGCTFRFWLPHRTETSSSAAPDYPTADPTAEQSRLEYSSDLTVGLRAASALPVFRGAAGGASVAAVHSDSVARAALCEMLAALGLPPHGGAATVSDALRGCQDLPAGHTVCLEREAKEGGGRCGVPVTLLSAWQLSPLSAMNVRSSLSEDHLPSYSCCFFDAVWIIRAKMSTEIPQPRLRRSSFCWARSDPTCDVPLTSRPSVKPAPQWPPGEGGQPSVWCMW